MKWLLWLMLCSSVSYAGAQDDCARLARGLDYKFTMPDACEVVFNREVHTPHPNGYYVEYVTTIKDRIKNGQAQNIDTAHEFVRLYGVKSEVRSQTKRVSKKTARVDKRVRRTNHVPDRRTGPNKRDRKKPPHIGNKI